MRDQLKDVLRDFSNKSETVKQSLQKSADLQLTNTVKLSSKIGNKLEDTAAGFKNLAVTVPDAFSHLEESIQENVTATKVAGVVKLTADVPGFADDLVKTVSQSDKDDLAAITGLTSEVEGGLLNVTIAMPSPDAVTAAVKEVVPTATADKLKTVAKDLVDVAKVELPDPAIRVMLAPALNITNPSDKMNNILDTVIADVSGIPSIGLDKLRSAAAKVSQEVGNGARINLGFGSLIEDAVEVAFSPAKSKLKSVLTKNGIPTELPKVDFINVAKAVTNNDIGTAANIIKKVSDKPEEAINDALGSINNSASQTAKDQTPPPPISTKSVSGKDWVAQWNNGEPEFEYFLGIPTALQVKTELLAVERDVTELLVFSMNSGEDYDYTVYDYYEAAYPGPYAVHYYIPKTGGVDRLVPAALEAEEGIALPNEHNKRSIVVMMEGGIIGPTPSLDGTDKQINYGATYPKEQMRSLKDLLKVVYEVYPGIQVLGGDRIGSPHPGPHFSVDDFIESHFNKSVLNIDWKTEGPPTIDDLNL